MLNVCRMHGKGRRGFMALQTVWNNIRVVSVLLWYVCPFLGSCESGATLENSMSWLFGNPGHRTLARSSLHAARIKPKTIHLTFWYLQFFKEIATLTLTKKNFHRTWLMCASCHKSLFVWETHKDKILYAYRSTLETHRKTAVFFTAWLIKPHSIQVCSFVLPSSQIEISSSGEFSPCSIPADKNKYNEERKEALSSGGLLLTYQLFLYKKNSFCLETD